MSDSSEKLSGDYTFVHKGKDYNYLIGTHTIYPNVIDYTSDENYILACQKPNKELYRSMLQGDLWVDYVIYNSYMKDSTTEKYYKTRTEILKDSTIFKIFKHRKVSFENSIEDIRKGEEIADSIIENNPIHRKVFSNERTYWIISIKNDSLIGPLTKSEYLVGRKTLELPKDLELK